MPSRASKRKKPSDLNQIAASIVSVTTGEVSTSPVMSPTETPIPEKNPAAVALGKLGASKGGKARAKKLSRKKRKDIAKKAAKARWERERER